MPESHAKILRVQTKAEDRGHLPSLHAPATGGTSLTLAITVAVLVQCAPSAYQRKAHVDTNSGELFDND